MNDDIQVYISDELIDLVPGQAIAMTYQLSNIGDLKNQRANFSNVFKAARTKENDRKLGYIADINSTDKRPYRLLPARIIVKGEDIVSNGYATIKRVDKYYHVLVYSGLLDLFEKLGDLKLSELDLSEFDHTFSMSTIMDNLNSTTGFCYPIIDYGQLIIRNTVLTDYMRFSVYVKELIERILDAAGFEQAGTFYNHNHYSKLILPFSNEKLTNKVAAVAGSVEADNLGFVVANQNAWTDVADFTVTKGNSGGCFDGTSYTVGSHAIRAKISFDGILSDSFVGTQKTALRFYSSTKGILSYVKQDIVGGSVTVKLDVPSIDYEAGEVVVLQVQHNQTDGVTVNGRLKITQDVVVPVNGFIPIAENLPDLKQKDFLKAIAQVYGLIYDIDVDTQTVRVRFFDDIIANKVNAKDWSNKLDISIQDDKTFSLDFAQVNKFGYNNGSVEGSEDNELSADAGNVAYSLGRGVITSDNKTLPADKDAVSLPFAATEEYSNTEVNGLVEDLTLPRIKIFTPTNKIVEFTSNNQVPFYYSPTAYGAPAQWNIATLYGTPNRVRHNGAVWEWQSATADDGKEPGVDLDNGDTGTNYTGLPYWKLIAIEDTFIFKQTIKVKPRLLLAAESNTLLFFQAEQHYATDNSSDIIVPIFSGVLDFTTRIDANYKVVQDTVNDTKLVRAYFTLTPNDIKTLDFLIPIFVGYYANYFYISRIDKYQHGQSTPVDLVKI